MLADTNIFMDMTDLLLIKFILCFKIFFQKLLFLRTFFFVTVDMFTTHVCSFGEKIKIIAITTRIKMIVDYDMISNLYG